MERPLSLRQGGGNPKKKEDFVGIKKKKKKKILVAVVALRVQLSLSQTHVVSMSSMCLNRQ